MARLARGRYLDPNKIQLAHCYNRCVRRAFLSGFDDYSGNDYSHRQSWFQDEMKLLASVFGIDIITYAIFGKSFSCGFEKPS